jgi:6-phosphogluconolactonase (cycloisomerase 2 family)
MKEKSRNISIILVLSVNVVLFVIFFLESCDYFNLLSRSEWEKKNGIGGNVYLYALTGTQIKAYEIDYNNNGKLNWKYSKNLNFGQANSSGSFINIDPENEFLYVGGALLNSPTEILGYHIDKNGDITQLNSFPKKSDFYQIAFDTDPDVLYARTFSNIRTYNLDRSTGAFSGGSDFSFGDICTSYSIVTDKAGKYVFESYRNNYNNNYNLKAAKTDSGLLSDKSGLIDCGYYSGIYGMDSTSGNFLYLADSSNIRGYGIKDGTFQNVSGTPVSVNSGTNVIKTSPDGKLLFATGSSNMLYSYHLNSNDGTVTSVASLGCTNCPTRICVEPHSRYVYVRSDNTAGASYVRIYKINDDGSFSETSGSPVSAETTVDIAVARK